MDYKIDRWINRQKNRQKNDGRKIDRKIADRYLLVVSREKYLSKGEVGGQVGIQQCLFSAAISDRQ